MLLSLLFLWFEIRPVKYDNPLSVNVGQRRFMVLAILCCMACMDVRIRACLSVINLTTIRVFFTTNHVVLPAMAYPYLPYVAASFGFRHISGRYHGASHTGLSVLLYLSMCNYTLLSCFMN